MVKQKKRKIKKNSKGAKGKPFTRIWFSLKLVLATLGILGIAYGTLRAGEYLHQLPYFKVSQIEVSGNRHLSDKQVRQLSGTNYRQNAFKINLEQVRQKLYQHPYIKQAVVERKLPQTLCIKIRERQGIAAVKTPSGYYLVDVEGVVLEKLGPGKKRVWPVLKGIDPQSVRVGGKITQGVNLLELLQARNSLREFACIDVSKLANPVLTTQRGKIKVALGKGDWENKLARFALVFQELWARTTTISSIDLRYQQMVVVKSGFGT